MIVLTFFAARMFMWLDFTELLGRKMNFYTNSEEYGASRDFFNPANLRALVIFLFILLMSTKRLRETPSFFVMLCLYACHVGIRFGFFDFFILSTRLSTSLGFAEVFLIPMVVNSKFQNAVVKVIFGALYIAVHLYVSLKVQAPFLIDDYFTPLASIL